MSRLTIADRDPGTDETGYFIGYPQGDPASVEAKYLGRDDVDVIDDLAPGRPPERLVGDYWVESRRIPNFSGTLGGMSGGPVLDGAGDVAERHGRDLEVETPLLRFAFGDPDAGELGIGEDDARDDAAAATR